MTERPILFSGEMVRAILENRKTQTRRVIKPHRGYECHTVCSPGLAADPWAVWFHYSQTVRVGHLVESPYGQPGERLWVRETAWLNKAFDYPLFVADGHSFVRDWKKTPAIHVPRKFSRITLEITKVRVERVQEISEADAVAEGIVAHRVHNEALAMAIPRSARDYYQLLWNELNAKRGFGWGVNPWVWVIEFRRLDAKD